MSTSPPGSHLPDGSPARLHPKDLAALADAVAARILPHLAPAENPSTPHHLVDAATVADSLGVSRAYVYEHAEDLGAQRLGDGPKPRLRFDLERARTCYASSASQATDTPVNAADPVPSRNRQPRRLPTGLPEPGLVLAIRPLGEEADRAA